MSQLTLPSKRCEGTPQWSFASSRTGEPSRSSQPRNAHACGTHACASDQAIVSSTNSRARAMPSS